MNLLDFQLLSQQVLSRVVVKLSQFLKLTSVGILLLYLWLADLSKSFSQLIALIFVFSECFSQMVVSIFIIAYIMHDSLTLIWLKRDNG